MQTKIRHRAPMYVLLASMMGFANAGCEKLEDRESFPVIEAIPAEFGELVYVTESPNQPYVATLWFEQPDKTIVAVRVNIAGGQIAAKTVKFTRS